jgi:hypothetical protein
MADGAAARPLAVRRRPAFARSRLRSLEENAPLVIGCACFAAALFALFSAQVMSDSWLNIVGGREIVRHGLPHHDELALVSHGRPWVDQQWLANLFFYGLYSLGGMSLAARINVLLTVLAIGLVFAYGRRRGGTRLSVLLCCMPLFLVALQFVRAQVVAQALFVALLALLAAESRQPSRRVLLAFPLLILWANIHGSVVEGAALVAILGLVELWQRVSGRARNGLIRPLALIVLPWACIFASPYGFELTTYYDATLRSSELPRFLGEWAPASISSPAGVLLFLLAAFALVLIARRPRFLTPFELAALALTCGAALHASRSITWFALAAGMLLPGLLDSARGTSRAEEPPAGKPALVLSGVVVSLALPLYGLVHPPNTLATHWPQAGPALVRRVLDADPRARVLASYDLADWLLVEAPSTRGRIAFDGRWEILSPHQLRSVRLFLAGTTANWDDLGRGYRYLVLGPGFVPHLIKTFERRPGVRVLYRSPHVVILDQGRAADRSP